MPTNNNETTVFVDIGILVYLDFVSPPPFPQMGGGILTIKVIDFILCNCFCQTWIFIKRGKKEHIKHD